MNDDFPLARDFAAKLRSGEIAQRGSGQRLVKADCGCTVEWNFVRLDRTDPVTGLDRYACENCFRGYYRH